MVLRRLRANHTAASRKPKRIRRLPAAYQSFCVQGIKSLIFPPWAGDMGNLRGGENRGNWQYGQKTGRVLLLALKSRLSPEVWDDEGFRETLNHAYDSPRNRTRCSPDQGLDL